MAVELVLLEFEQLRRGDEVALVVGVPEAAVGAHAQARGTAHPVRKQLELAGTLHAHGPTVEAAPGSHGEATGSVCGIAAVMHEVQREVVSAILAAHGA